jgi:hypothetical protein
VAGRCNAGYPLTTVGLDTDVADTSYTSRGAPTKLTLGTGTKRLQMEKALDPATGRLTENRVSTENQTTPNTWVPQLIEHYGYDDAGNVKNVKEVTGTGTTVSNQCFTYDALRRLSEAWTTTAGTCQASHARIRDGCRARWSAQPDNILSGLDQGGPWSFAPTGVMPSTCQPSSTKPAAVAVRSEAMFAGSCR